MKDGSHSHAWRTLFLALTATVLAGVTGCSWDSSNYDEYVSKDGKFGPKQVCPEGVVLVQIGDNKCTNAANCPQYAKAFENLICPSLFPYCIETSVGSGQYQCSATDDEIKELTCDPGQHSNGVQCVSDSVEDCGAVGVDCSKTLNNADQVSCILENEVAKCVALACVDGYHLKDKQCFRNTNEECGASLENCTLNIATGLMLCSNGACASRCGENEDYCDGNCLIFNNVHVSSCKNDVLSCKTGYADWDHDLSNGCETRLSSIHVSTYDPETDTIECANNYADCDGEHYAAKTEADPETGEPVVQPANGCEVDLRKGVVESIDMGDGTVQTQTNHCGRCSDPETDVAGTEAPICNQEYTCSRGDCVINNCSLHESMPDLCYVLTLQTEGDNPILDEEGNPVYDYEYTCLNIHSEDAQNCGECGYVCSNNPIATASSNRCENGVCQYECKSGYTQCNDEHTATGIVCIKNEAFLQDGNNCGECGHVCNTGYACLNGKCEQSTCADTEKLCGISDCRVVNGTDANNCGACDYICANNPTATATSSECRAGVCQYTCKTGYTHCGGTTAEDIVCLSNESLLSDSNNCGACGKTCGKNKVCVNGECVTNSCKEDALPDLCAEESGNVCRNVKSSDANNCGSCGYICANHSTAVATSSTCSSGVCQYTCKSGYKYCGGTTAEDIVCIKNEDLQSDGNNCGDCGNRCGLGTACVGGKCVTNSCNSVDFPNLCAESTGNVCRNVRSNDASNCGACGYICSNNPTATAISNSCNGGVCQYTCKSGYTHCGGNTADDIVCIKTEDLQSDGNNCGTCGNVCGTGLACVGGKCVTNSCTDSAAPNLCAESTGNVCRNIKSTDANNCGACGYICSEHPTATATSSACSGGVCQYTCKQGYTHCGGSSADDIICIKNENLQTDSNNCGACGKVCGINDKGEKTVCVAGKCVTNSCTDNKLPDLCQETTGNVCRNIKSTDASNCGSCGYICSNHPTATAISNSCNGGVCQYVCKSGYTHCGGTTVNDIICIKNEDLQSDGNNCGSCGNVCTTGTACVGGECVTNSCTDSAKPNLCAEATGNVCRNIKSTDASNCGSCGYVCSNHPTATATSNTCVSGVCQYECKSGYTHCGGSTADDIICIKNEDLLSDGNNCGACGHECNTGEACVGGECVTNSCTDSAKPNLCAEATGNVCRNIKSTDANNCGSCGYICSNHPTATAISSSCNGGVCQYVCKSGYTHCGGTTADDIVCIKNEDLQSDGNNCGSCGNVCGKGTACVGGECVTNSCTDSSKPNLCAESTGNVCRNIKSNDANNCGSCGYICSNHPTATAISNTCASGVCQYECKSGYKHCGGTTADDIVCIKNEDLQSDGNNCGRCGNVCVTGTACVGGECVTNSCSGSTPHLCVESGVNVCKNVLSADADNCGACGYKCSNHPTATAVSTSCNGGVCQYSCKSGYTHCGGTTADDIVCIKTEDLQSDGNNCGTCGHVCDKGTACVGGECVTNSCTDSSKPNLCQEVTGNVCRNVNSTDAANCGACGYICASHPTATATSNSCNGGVCQYTCKSGYTHCGGTTANDIICIKNEDLQSDGNNCGACGKECNPGEACVGGACVTNSCMDSTLPNLCAEAGGNKCRNIHSDDLNNCGACGYKCSEHATVSATSNSCVNGVCQYTCRAGYTQCAGSGNTFEDIVCVSEASLKTDSLNCGTCGRTCESGKVCVDGECVINSCTDSDFPNLCAEADGNACRNIHGNDLSNCGACGYTCPNKANTTVSCNSGTCEYSCTGTLVNCGSSTEPNCIDPATSNQFCGVDSSCKNGHECVSPYSCSSSSCERKCDTSEYGCNGRCYDLDSLNALNRKTDCSCVEGAIAGSGTFRCTMCGSGQVPNTAQTACVCDEENSWYEINGVCVHDPLYKCGPDKTNCHTLEGWSEGHCNNSTGCVATSCQTGYYLSSGVCKQINNEHCGADTRKCDPVLNGTNQCNVSAQQCELTCDAGYHAYNKSCEADDDYNCGNHDVACEDAHGVSSCDMSGSTPVCKVSSCDIGYYKNADSTACVESTNDHCGSLTNDCTIPPETGEGICDKNSGTCSVNCNAGYHKYNQSGKLICEADTNEHCGTHTTVCSPNAAAGESGSSCMPGEGTSSSYYCQKTCANTHFLDGNTCVANTVAHCGSMTTECLISNFDGATSVDCDTTTVPPACVATGCRSGYTHNADGTCSKDAAYCTDSKCENGKYQACTGNLLQPAENCQHYGEANVNNANLCVSGHCVTDFTGICNTGYYWNGSACVALCEEDSCVEGKLYECGTDQHLSTTGVTCNSGVANAAPACNLEGNACVLACKSGWHVNGDSCEKDCTSAVCDTATGQIRSCIDGILQTPHLCDLYATEHADITQACANTTSCSTTLHCADGFESIDNTTCTAVFTCTPACLEGPVAQNCGVSAVETTTCTASGTGMIAACRMVGEGSSLAAECYSECDAEHGYVDDGHGGCEVSFSWTCTNTPAKCVDNKVMVCETTGTEYTVAENGNCDNITIPDGSQHATCNPTTFVCDCPSGYAMNDAGNACSPVVSTCERNAYSCVDGQLKLCDSNGTAYLESWDCTSFEHGQAKCDDDAITNHYCTITKCDNGFDNNGAGACTCTDGNIICGGTNNKVIKRCNGTTNSYSTVKNCGTETSPDPNGLLICQAGSAECVLGCNSGYKLNDAGDACVPNSTYCTGTQVCNNGQLFACTGNILSSTPASECAHYGETGYLNNKMCNTDNTDCLSPYTNVVCDTGYEWNGSACVVTCAEDCSLKHDDHGVWACNTTTGQCELSCTDAGDINYEPKGDVCSEKCSSLATLICNGNELTTCDSDGFVISRKTCSAVCNEGIGCVACNDDSDCSGSTPACDNHECIACTDDRHCSGTTPFCDNVSTPHACVACKSYLDCHETEKPDCSETTHTCVPCPVNQHWATDHCEADEPEHCGSVDNNCTASDTHAMEAVCESAQCRITKCEENYHLSSLTSNNTCVLNTNDACAPAGSASTVDCGAYACDTNGSCKTSCDSSSDCADGYVCNGDVCVSLTAG